MMSMHTELCISNFMDDSEANQRDSVKIKAAIVSGIFISEDQRTTILPTVKVYAEVTCPRCSIRLASYEKYVESSKAVIGNTVSISFTGSCYNRGYPGSGAFDWSGTVVSAVIYEIPSD